MDSFFGLISMNKLALIMAGIVLAILVILLVLGASNWVLLKMGLRNIPRRPSQTVLIIFGLMLSSLIITASFGIGDTFGYSIKTQQLDTIGNLDEGISKTNASAFQQGSAAAPYFTADEAQSMLTTIKGSTDVAHVTGAIKSSGAVFDLDTHETSAQNMIIAVAPDFNDVWGTMKSTRGVDLQFRDLTSGQIFLGKTLATKLNAQPGQKIQLFIENQPNEFIVRDIMNTEISAGATTPNLSTVIVPLAQYQEIVKQPGAINIFYLKNQGSGGLDDLGPNNSRSETISSYLRDKFTDAGTAQQIKEIVNQPKIKDQLKLDYTKLPSYHPAHQPLGDLLAELDQPGVTSKFKFLIQDSSIQNLVASDIAKLDQSLLPKLLFLQAKISIYNVQPFKEDGIVGAQTIANLSVGFLLTVSLFSIAVGVLLIFLIFVMLAAERKPEMGMSRAVGMKRRHLTQMFIFEGTAYTLGSAVIGVALGVGVGVIMVESLGYIFGDLLGSFTLRSHIEFSSIVVSFCLGILLTFVVVAISSYRVSRLNIVAAIRDLEDDHKTDEGLAKIARKLLSFGFALAAWRLIWALFKRGPFTILLGLFLLNGGVVNKVMFQYILGVSFLIIGLGLLLRWIMTLSQVKQSFTDRLGFSLISGLLLFYLAQPFGPFEKLIGIYDRLDIINYTSGTEMFFISSMLLVLAAIWLIIYNSDWLIKGVMFLTSRLGSLAPITRTSMAYPMAFKFRTGVTVAMFAIVIFVIIFISVLNDVLTISASNPVEQTGSWPIAVGSPVNPDDQAIGQALPVDLSQQFSTNPDLSKQIAAVGAETKQVVSLRQISTGIETVTGLYLVRFVDDAYLNGTTYKIQPRAEGYNSDRQVWDALKTTPNLAVIDGGALTQRGGDPMNFNITGIKAKDKSFKPFQIEMVDTQGHQNKVTIIGVIDNPYWSGLYASTQTGTTFYGNSTFPQTGYYFKVKPGVDMNQTRLSIGAALSKYGLEPIILADLIKKQNGLSTALTNLLKGFLALGLIVGIAGLGVISSRAVVERRQQIGMLRAIGYSRALVQRSFLLESSFIAILGLLIGTGLGIWESYKFISDNSGLSNLSFHVPYGEISIILVVSYIATLLTTYLPARSAAQVKPAEALRYE